MPKHVPPDLVRLAPRQRLVPARKHQPDFGALAGGRTEVNCYALRDETEVVLLGRRWETTGRRLLAIRLTVQTTQARQQEPGSIKRSIMSQDASGSASRVPERAETAQAILPQSV
jgi:hypothetical protein